MRLRTFLSLLFLLALLLIGVAAGGAVWLAASERGLETVGRLLVSASGGRLALSGLRGRLFGPMFADELSWRSQEILVAARGVEIDWTPSALPRRRLEIGVLKVGGLSVETLDSNESSSSPDDLTLPLAVSIRRLAVDSLRWNGAPPVTALAVRLTSDGRRHVVETLSFTTGDFSVTGGVTLDGRAPFSLQGNAKVSGTLAGHPVAMSLTAGGALARVELAARLLRGAEGEAQATLTPFATLPFGDARAELRGLVPSDWFAGAPDAKLDLAARLETHDGREGGAPEYEFIVINRQAGPFDHRRIPFETARIKVSPEDSAARLQVRLTLPGGALEGSGRWSSVGSLDLDLEAKRLDAARLVSTLLPTRFDGPLAVSLDAGRQSARLAWRDERWRLQADVEHAGGTLTVKALEIAAHDTLLTVSGRLELEGEQAFAATGKLRGFDPSRFARAPAARLDADFEAKGHLTPQPAVEGRFSLGESSRHAGLPLAGKGRLSLAWPRIHGVDAELSAGPNRVRATGGFGRDGDRLSLDIDAPRLAPFGIDGQLRGRVDLTGSPQRPSLALDLAAPRLSLPDLGSFSGLRLQAGLALEPDAPLRLEFALERFSRPGETDSVRAVKARATGSCRSHRVEAGGVFTVSGHARQLRLAAEGGLSDDRRWLGQLRELILTENEGPFRLELRRPAPLSVGLSGGSIGPLALAGSAPDWTAELGVEADAERLRMDLAADGKEFGHIKGGIEAGMRGPWQIAMDSPWRGSIELDAPELAWLGGLSGGGWRTGGKLAGTLEIAGTPASPRPIGRFDGSELSLELADQGLRLVDGELAAEFDGGALRIVRLAFASALTEPPRALRLELGNGAQRFAAPGRLEVSGELSIGGAGAENAFLDARLDRVGVWQSSDQWIAVSGAGRIAWRARALDVSGEIGVDAGYWQLAPAGMPRLSDDVLLKNPGRPERDGTRLNLDLELKANLGRHFLFRGAGLRTWLDGDVRLSAQGRDLPRAAGAIRLRDGRFDAYGQQLDIERGFLTFHGLLDDPALDVRAMRKGLAVEAGVEVGGTARRPVVRLVSDPDLPDPDKLSWLLLGHGPESMGVGDAATLVSAAGGLLGDDSGGVVQQLKDAFGIDEFGVRQGEIGGDGGRAPASRIAPAGAGAPAAPDNQILTVGKRLSAHAALTYEQSLTNAESVIKLTVNLTRRIAVIGRAGSDNALDVFYTLTFGQPPGRR
ncbi:MAG: translocation/assembly module TamB domain-containing protein [Candidatus Accumulibacter sp.]|jgi:translocation and assembly module TamB|nr:translocation/assembly module TamB domain-containing protein [Accumulibacter sp.]